MPEIAIRVLSDVHVIEARDLSNRNPDVFTAWVLDRLPNYFEIDDALEDREESLKLERLALGAFADGRMIGAVSVGRADRLAMLGAIAPDWEERLAGFSEHEVNMYFTLSGDWRRSLPSPPEGSLFIHSLCVDRPHRGQGVATSLVSEAIRHLDDAERSSLYMGVARVRGYRRFCDSLGFRVVSKRFSLSDRLQFGCWGAALFRFTKLARGRGEASGNARTGQVRNVWGVAALGRPVRGMQRSCGLRCAPWPGKRVSVATPGGASAPEA